MRKIKGAFRILSALVVLTSVVADQQFDCSQVTDDKCKCSEKTADIRCQGTRFGTIPSTFSAEPSALRVLTISGDNFTGGVLGGGIVYTGLTALHLDSDEIRRIVPGVFSNVSFLDSLVLTNNRLVYLERGTFDGLNRLTLLDLADNPIYLLEWGVLSGNVLPLLMTLDLSRCRLSDVDPGALAHLAKLQEVNMTSNRLVRMPALGPGLGELKELDLSWNRLSDILNASTSLAATPSLQKLILNNNRIECLSSTSFCPSADGKCGSKLEELVLRHNRLNDVTTGAWSPLRSLQRLDLAYNLLTRLNGSELPKTLHMLLIHDNQWDCSDCENTWLLESPVDHWNSHKSVVCATPESLAGRSIYQPPDEDDVFDDCNSTPGGGGGTTVLLTISAFLVAVLTAVAVLCLCRRRSRQRRRATTASTASPIRHARPLPTDKDDVTVFRYRQMEEM